MSDTPAPETAPESSAPVESGQPETQTQPDTPETNPTPPNDAQIQRLTNQVNGMKGLVDPLVQGGVRTAEDVQAALEAKARLDSFREAGINIDSLLAQRSKPDEQQPQTQQGDYLTREGLQEVLDTREAQSTHRAKVTAAMDNLKSFASETGGDDSDLVLDITMSVAQKYLQEKGERYPANHPLYESDYQPLSDAQINEVKDLVQKRIDKIKGMSARQALENQIPDGQTPGTGGNMDGAASSKSGTGLPDKAARQARVQELLRRNLAQAAGESISNA